MTGVAPISGHLSAVHFPKDSSAVRTVIWHLFSQRVNFRYVAQHSSAISAAILTSLGTF